MTRKEALFAVIGGVVGAVLVMAAGLFSPLGAHNEVRDAEFGVITCRRIRVVNPDAHFDRMAVMGTDERGGYVEVYGEGYKKGAEMRILKYGGGCGRTRQRENDGKGGDDYR